MKKRMQRGLFSLLATVLAISVCLPVYAHSGRTDGSGGHRDNQNRSGLGYYHYHHGMGPHLHPNGRCPYSPSSTTKTTSSTTKSSKTVKAAQKKLNKLGYKCGKADGKLGKKTIAAIKKFQKKKGIKATGTLNKTTKKKLGIH